ncbi:MAG: alpha-2-macroglobulin family protein, partial [bacterium]|nr:alpha-2-macroglobulin family protein [bacterium]
VRFDVRVTDQRGIPIRAEVGLALVDDAILSLAPRVSPSLAETFYASQRNRIRTGISLRGLADDLLDEMGPPGMGGGGGGWPGDIAPTIDPRSDFETTPLWIPNVITDEDGHASVSVIMPDNLTRWHLDAQVVSLSTLVGQSELRLVSSLPFFVRPQTPRFLVVGDTVELAMFVNNETATAQTITASIQAEGVTLLDAPDWAVTLPPHSQQRIAWRAVVEDVPSVDVTFMVGNDVVQDAAKPALPDNLIPVLSYVAPDTLATAGILDEPEVRAEVVRPPSNALKSELRLSLASSLTESAADALNAFPPAPDERLDKIIGRLMINVALYHTDGHETLSEAIADDLARLDELQAQSGGWAWISTIDSGDPFTTGYAIIALAEAAQMGFAEADALRSTACDTIGPSGLLDASSSSASFNQRAFTIYVRSLCGIDNGVYVENLFAYRDRLSTAAKSYLLISLNRATSENRSMAQTLRDDLLGSAILTGTGVHWEGEYWRMWDTDTLTTAVALRAFIRVSPDIDLLSNTVRWLVVARSGDLWETPIDTGLAVTALVDYAAAFNEANTDYTVDVRLNAVPAAASLPSTGLNEQLVLPLGRSESDQTLELERSVGDGVLYYTAVLHSTLDAASTPPIARGITMTREYLDVDGNPLNQVVLGESVFVRLTVTASQDIYYFVLDDPLPAGLIADDPSLINVASSGISVSRLLSRGDYRWFYGSSAFSRSVYGDSQIHFYADALPQGTYIVTYEAQAAIAGEFQVMPTHAYAAIMPDVFGRTAGQMLVIAAPPVPAG